MDLLLRRSIGIIIILGLIALILGIIWLIINKVKKKSLKFPTTILLSSIVVVAVFTFSVMYFWKLVGTDDIPLRRSQYNDYERIAKSINVLKHAPDHSDSVAYSKKVKHAKHILKETTDEDIKKIDSKIRRQGREDIYHLAVDHIPDDDYSSDNDYLGYAKSILSYHVNTDLKNSYDYSDTNEVITYFNHIADK
ncbi:hypothetical protein [Pediococcus acidilactici]|uniref:hypothetical protein n=1 Tax=Pediococcus acidilactici TaxID=1254 RepID=UPI003B427C05